MKVKECMCKNVCCVKPDTQLTEIARLMSENHIGCVPVCDDKNCICGVITDRDVILRTIACGKNPLDSNASEIMTTNVCTCKENDEMENAENQMSENQIRRLPVCDQNNHVIGIITLGDLANKDFELGMDEVCSTIDEICNCKSKRHAD